MERAIQQGFLIIDFIYLNLYRLIIHQYIYFNCSNMSTKNLKYLSSEQALADLAYFIEGQNNQFGLTGNKWIVFGGSYPGSLAAWFRLKYPHLAYGAVASSAPLLAKINFKGMISSYLEFNLFPKIINIFVYL